MIKVINGTRYNTETAERAFVLDNGHFINDFKYREKTLHRTSKGAWFIHHVGGPMTDMASTVGNETTGSERIEPITADDAFGFLQAHSNDMDASDSIETYFSDRTIEA